MAINNALTGLITAASTYTSVQGTLQLEFTAVGENAPELVNINLSKLAKGENFSIVGGGNAGYEGHRFLGSSYGIRLTTGLASNQILTHETLAVIHRVTGGYGNVNILTRPAVGDTQPAEYTVVPVERLVGRTLPIGTVIPQGSYIFASTLGTTTVSTTFSKFSQPTLGAITAGHGTAKLTNVSGFEAIIRLNEVDYPFTTVTGDSLELIGSAVAFRG